jgi:serine/threonine-protein kinase
LRKIALPLVVVVAPYSSMADVTVGMILDERYLIVRPLGAGGMGTVFEAESLVGARRVAVKVLKPEHASRHKAVKRFLREARALSMIDHPNVVQTIGFGELHSGAVYYAMEYLEGYDLSGLIARDGHVPWRRARDIFMQIAGALQAAHDVGIIHRDVKPANCFISTDPASEGLVKVLDFGIAKNPGADTNALTGTSELLGTVRYMSPEQANGLTADARSDLYSLGVTMYETLTGRVPFDGDNAFHVLYRHTKEPPQPLRELVADIPAWVEAIVLRALAKRPEDRFESMRELLDALSAISEEGSASSGNPNNRTGATIPVGELHYASLPQAQPQAVVDPASQPIDVGLPDMASKPLVADLPALVAASGRRSGLPSHWAASPAPIAPRRPVLAIVLGSVVALAVGIAIAFLLVD